MQVGYTVPIVFYGDQKLTSSLLRMANFSARRPHRHPYGLYRATFNNKSDLLNNRSYFHVKNILIQLALVSDDKSTQKFDC